VAYRLKSVDRWVKVHAFLYASDSVLWGTQSPTLRDSPADFRDFFKILLTVDPSNKVVLGKQQIRDYGGIAMSMLHGQRHIMDALDRGAW
jgi:hypothetical protein